jgi:alkanesulfonate monooxygenase SsuD/methylene tetrahydromethanopterin reductase-like flavin-dependent oxidoreductase (luciferase family)
LCSGPPVSRRTRASLDRAARLAEGWIASPGLTYDEAPAQADLHRERCAAYGRPPGVLVLRRDVYVGASASEAQPVLQQALSRGYRGMPAEALIAGTVEEVAEQFRTFGEIGYTEILVRSFVLQGLGMIVEDIVDTLLRLLDVHRIGAAVEYVWSRPPARPAGKRFYGARAILCPRFSNPIVD